MPPVNNDNLFHQLIKTIVTDKQVRDEFFDNPRAFVEKHQVEGNFEHMLINFGPENRFNDWIDPLIDQLIQELFDSTGTTGALPDGTVSKSSKTTTQKTSKGTSGKKPGR